MNVIPKNIPIMKKEFVIKLLSGNKKLIINEKKLRLMTHLNNIISVI